MPDGDATRDGETLAGLIARLEAKAATIFDPDGIALLREAADALTALTRERDEDTLAGRLRLLADAMRAKRGLNEALSHYCDFQGRANEEVVREAVAALSVQGAALREAEARARALRAALEAVEWAREDYNEADWGYACPWCDADQSSGHTPDCRRQAALRATAPEAPKEGRG